LLVDCILCSDAGLFFYSRHFEDGFGLIFYANAYDLKDNKCYKLDTTQFGDLIYSICKQAEKIKSPEIKKQIKEDFKLEKHLVIRLRYAEFVDDVPAHIEITSDGYLRDSNEYYQIKKEQYVQLIDFIKNSEQCK
jgi:hypothetical protein